MNKIRIGLDLYGGDNAPESTIQGAVFALKNRYIKGENLFIIGKNEKAVQELKDYNVNFIDAEDLIDNETKPTQVLKLKKSSIFIGCDMMKKNELDAFVSAGNTGALLSAGTFVAGRLKGIKRPALNLAIPGANGNLKIIADVGANAVVRAEHYYDFAREGIAYAKYMGIKNPSVGIINIGTEEEKGSPIVKEAADYIKEKEINYYGFVESRDIFTTDADVIITDGFTGNVILKTVEGTAYYVLKELKKAIKDSGPITKLGALMVKGALSSLKNKLDYRSYGGTFFLGINGVLVKAHGSSDDEAIGNALYQAYNAAEKDLVSNIML